MLYEHFRDKSDLLTQIAVEAIALLATRITEQLPEDGHAAIATMIERYWAFMLGQTQIYRLINGMDGVPIDKDVVGRSAQSLCKAIGEAVRPLVGENANDEDGQLLADQVWALLHGMAALYLDRFAPFDLMRATNAAMKLIRGAVSPG